MHTVVKVNHHAMCTYLVSCKEMSSLKQPSMKYDCDASEAVLLSR